MRKKLVQILYIFLSLVFFSSCSVSKTHEQKTINASVISVYDGDTFTTSTKKRFRIFGIDTPEIKDRQGVETKGQTHIFAKNARAFLWDKILNKKVNIVPITHDKYGRNVSKILIDNEDVGLEVLKNGLAIVRYISEDRKSPFYTNDREYYKKLLDASFYAQVNKKGFWKEYSSLDEIEEKLYKNSAN
ncbi:thermonuclease family protein [Mycoplasma procyoni]|uniref:thermonuclease family protein n=1 Tax=Mycoplasma procyoni TaxID=568784 RepID=UPI00197C17FB|nr:thermonuclease family protein [Mycoplasma procyoni]MBN3534868.1 thermonuclease family protein [Mycoplasma procyoni]